jgi:hypothetical protein
LKDVTEIVLMSDVVRARKVGAAEPDVGPANTVWALWFASDSDRVPLVTTGDPDTVKIGGAARLTLVTAVGGINHCKLAVFPL